MAGARELSLCFAPYVNSYKRYQPSSWAPTAVAWGLDNRTLGFRVVGHGDGRRVECRIPGADANPYYAFAATIASGLHGIEHHLEPGDPYVGNGYTAGGPAPSAAHSRRRDRSVRRPPSWREEAFGDDVHAHLLEHGEAGVELRSTSTSPIGSVRRGLRTAVDRQPMRPLIAVTTRLVARDQARRPRRRAGRARGVTSTPSGVPAARRRRCSNGTITDAEADEVVQQFDGLVLIGGADVDPAHYGADGTRGHLRQCRRTSTRSTSPSLGPPCATARRRSPSAGACRC